MQQVDCALISCWADFGSKMRHLWICSLPSTHYCTTILHLFVSPSLDGQDEVVFSRAEVCTSQNHSRARNTQWQHCSMCLKYPSACSQEVSNIQSICVSHTHSLYTVTNLTWWASLDCPCPLRCSQVCWRGNTGQDSERAHRSPFSCLTYLKSWLIQDTVFQLMHCITAAPFIEFVTPNWGPNNWYVCRRPSFQVTQDIYTAPVILQPRNKVSHNVFSFYFPARKLWKRGRGTLLSVREGICRTRNWTQVL